MAPAVEKKIVDLEMGLLHLQQNIDIPEISLPIHPVVSSVIKKCAEEGRKPKVEDFGDKVEDAQFLNALQSGVNRWIREIQKVHKVILFKHLLMFVIIQVLNHTREYKSVLCVNRLSLYLVLFKKKCSFKQQPVLGIKLE